METAKAIKTIKVQWNAISGRWTVTALDQMAAGSEQGVQSLASWAEVQADLTPVRLILSACNYATHWVSLPGVSNRHLARALPYALEEGLIDDLSDYLIQPAGSEGKKVRAYVVGNDLIERLLEECELHHLQVRELIPETQLLPQDVPVMLRQGQGWAMRIPGVFEGWVTDSAMTPVLESLFDHGDEEQSAQQVTGLQIMAAQLDQAQLLKTTLESSFAGVFAEIELLANDGNQLRQQRLQGKLTNLLTGRFQVREVAEDRPPVWWRGLAAVAAVWLVAATLYLFIDNYTLKQQSQQVRAEAISLYKNLFPGERIRSLERQIKTKLDGGDNSDGAGFIGTTSVLARVYAAQGLQKQVQLMSLRFNDRLQELVVEVRASNLNELQTLRAALEKEGLVAEVASATNDKDGVKGRIKIGGSA
ncbi:type II secretion system protein GspL [Thalassolituus sp. UBA2009]|jgi:general secretion pathway protein L|uniref:type II secretion system protein GspL n=1 Tax=Thalassolituus sp. UBA2009 TaxID=1947658 RepID=UPI00257AC863|nr:type II secretion system protein GspL [Thalassolituus sp. UBA2009]